MTMPMKFLNFTRLNLIAPVFLRVVKFGDIKFVRSLKSANLITRKRACVC